MFGKKEKLINQAIIKKKRNKIAASDLQSYMHSLKQQLWVSSRTRLQKRYLFFKAQDDSCCFVDFQLIGYNWKFVS